LRGSDHGVHELRRRRHRCWQRLLIESHRSRRVARARRSRSGRPRTCRPFRTTKVRSACSDRRLSHGTPRGTDGASARPEPDVVRSREPVHASSRLRLRSRSRTDRRAGLHKHRDHLRRRRARRRRPQCARGRCAHERRACDRRRRRHGRRMLSIAPRLQRNRVLRGPDVRDHHARAGLLW
jgi:hypothetical protein